MNLESAPFPHAQRENGYIHNGAHFARKGHYDDNSVVLFFPNSYRFDEKVDMVFYFHGWDRDLSGVLASYRVVEQFVRSRKNAILVLPQGPKNAPDSFGGKLEDADGFKNMVGEILLRLMRAGMIKNEIPGDLILAGHSGGYHVISSILTRGGLTDHIKEVYLFDALYGEIEKFTDWQDRQKGKIIDLYTEDGGTKEESEGLIEELGRRNIPYYAATDTDISGRDLESNRIIFIYTAVGHDEVVYKNDSLFRFLSASVLKDAI